MKTMLSGGEGLRPDENNLSCSSRHRHSAMKCVHTVDMSELGSICCVLSTRPHQLSPVGLGSHISPAACIRCLEQIQMTKSII